MSDDEKYNEEILNELKDNEDDSDSEAEESKVAKGAAELAEKLEKLKEERKLDEPKTIFIGNLVKNVQKSHIMKLFKDFGNVKTIRIRTDNGKKFKAVKELKNVTSVNSYVVFETEDEARKACELNGHLFKGLHIRVNMANEKETPKDKSKFILFVGNLKYSATEEKLYEIFDVCGEIEQVRTIKGDMGCKGVAYVTFKKRESVQLGLELNGTMLDDRPIRVERYAAGRKGNPSHNPKLAPKDAKNNQMNVRAQSWKDKKGKEMKGNQQNWKDRTGGQVKGNQQNWKNRSGGDFKGNQQNWKDKRAGETKGNQQNWKDKKGGDMNGKKVRKEFKPKASGSAGLEDDKASKTSQTPKKSPGQKVFAGKKADRTKKKNKLGKGMKMKKKLANKIAPRTNK